MACTDQNINATPNEIGNPETVTTVECKETGALYIIDEDNTDAWIQSDFWIELGDLEPRPEVDST